jgi:hypothetical protein
MKSYEQWLNEIYDERVLAYIQWAKKNPQQAHLEWTKFRIAHAKAKRQQTKGKP